MIGLRFPVVRAGFTVEGSKLKQQSFEFTLLPPVVHWWV